MRATSAKVDSVGAYGIEATNGRVFVMLFNKHTAGERVVLTLAGGGDRATALYRMSAAMPWGPAGTAALTGGTLAITLPARSAALAVVAAPATTDAGDAPSATSTRASFAFAAAPIPAHGTVALSFTLSAARALGWPRRRRPGCARGVYFARLRVGDRVAAIRLVRR